MKNTYIIPFRYSRSLSDIKFKSGIYKLINTTNGKFYIGSSNHLPGRKRLHFGTLRRNCNVNKNLQSDYNIYGRSAFRFQPIEEVRYEDQLRIREQFWLDKYAAENKHLLYNRSLNSESLLGVKMSAQTLAKMSIAQSGQKNAMFGKYGTVVENGITYSLCKRGHTRNPSNLIGFAHARCCRICVQTKQKANGTGLTRKEASLKMWQDPVIRKKLLLSIAKARSERLKNRRI